MAAQCFTLTTPHMHGSDVKAFQGLLNKRFDGWKINVCVDADGEYGPTSEHAARRVCLGLGLDPKTYAPGMTAAVRARIADPAMRTPADLKRADAAKAWRDALRDSADTDSGAMAVTWARKQVGTSESPPHTNRGPKIDTWNRACGIPPGPNAFWCGAFANAALHAAGQPNGAFMAYCPNIEARARAGIGGWSWVARHQDGQPGDLVLFSKPSTGSTAAHVELLVSAKPFVTIGGNTGSAGHGSQDNGGCVAQNTRDPNLVALKVKGLARPPWD